MGSSCVSNVCGDFLLEVGVWVVHDTTVPAV